MLREMGVFKNRIAPALYKDEPLRLLLLGDTYAQKYTSESAVRKALKSHIFSHLFVDDVITETQSYIFYDIDVPRSYQSSKDVRIIMYGLCHKDILESYQSSEYPGNRVDALSQIIEQIILNPATIRDFGIGKINLDTVSLYRNEKKFYGKILEFVVPNFRYL